MEFIFCLVGKLNDAQQSSKWNLLREEIPLFQVLRSFYC